MHRWRECARISTLPFSSCSLTPTPQRWQPALIASSDQFRTGNVKSSETRSRYIDRKIDRGRVVGSPASDVQAGGPHGVRVMGDRKMSSAARKLFSDMGVTYYAPNRQRCREPLATCCDKFVGRLIEQHGLPHVSMVLRAIAESEGNGNALISDVIGAVSDIVRWPAMGLAFIEALD